MNKSLNKCLVCGTHYAAPLPLVNLVFGTSLFLHCLPDFPSQMLCAFLSPCHPKPLILEPPFDWLQTSISSLSGRAGVHLTRGGLQRVAEGTEMLLRGLLWA